MAPRTKKSVFDVEEGQFDRGNPLEIKIIRLKDIFTMETISSLKLLTHYGLLREFGGECPSCPSGPAMNLVSSKDRSDGWKWRCPKCVKRERSLRYDSVFCRSNLDIKTHFALLYMWAQDFENRHAERELSLDHTTVTFWFAQFRQICVEYSQRLGKIGGVGKIVELQELEDSDVLGIRSTTGENRSQEHKSGTASLSNEIRVAAAALHVLKRETSLPSTGSSTVTLPMAQR